MALSRESAELAAEISAKRERFAKSVAELDARLDFDARRKNASERVRAVYQGNPIPFWIGAGILGVVAISAVAWAVFSDD